MALNNTSINEPAPVIGQGRMGNFGANIFRIRELSVLVVTVVLIVYFSLANSEFLTSDNFGNIADFFSAVALIAVGEVFLLICGEIDLSAGYTFALAPIIMVTLNGDGIPLGLAIVICLVFSALVGLFNGVVNQFIKLPSFITTLGTYYILHGIALKIAGSTPLPAPGSSGTPLSASDNVLVQIFGEWQWSELLWALVIGIVLHLVLTQTRWGTHTIATGANPIAASEAGIRVRSVKIRAFVLTAVLAGLGGILDGTNIAKSFDPNAGGSVLTFSAIAAAVIGGTLLIGGSGTIIGALLGALLLAVLQDGFNIQGVDATTFVIVEGAAILLAMTLNIYLSRFRRRAKEQ
jgi:simple sugar transport system permease protein